MYASLRDIAKALNLSTTTVSWVLSGKGAEHGISAPTCEKVEKCAKEMNYQPNLLARGLHVGKSNTLGLIVPSIGDQFYSSLVRFMELEAEKNGYAIMVSSSENDQAREDKMVDILRAKQVDGILMAPTKFSSAKIEEMLKDDFPFVLFDRYFPEFNTNYVIIDNEMASYRLVRHLFEKGYKKPAILTTNMHLYTMQMRKVGWRDAYSDSGLPADDSLCVSVDSRNYSEGVASGLDALLEKEPDVDSFFFATHQLATYFFLYCAEKGIKRNFGYASIHTEKLFDVLAPKMSVAYLPIKSIGKEAVRILLQDISRCSEKKSGVQGGGVRQGVVLSCDIQYKD